MFQDVILWPREQARYALTSQVDGFVSQRTVTIVNGLPPYQLPDNPSWSEDPHNSRSWALYFNSMGWLFAAEAAYKQGRFEGFVDYAKSMILDFMATNTDRENPAHPMAFHDGANAFRMATIAYVYETYLKPGNADNGGVTFSQAEQTLFAQGLRNERDQLVENLAAGSWDDSNHKFFHAMALASYATVFGNAEGTPYVEPNAASLLAQGLTGVDEVLAAIINLEHGVTREQSLTYHRLDMGLVMEAQDSISAHGFSLGRDYSTVLDKMVEFDVLTNRPGVGNVPHVAEIGDTYFGAPVGSYYMNQANARGYGTAHSDYVRSKGVTGVRPPDLIDYSDAGYIVVRPEYKWEHVRDMRILMDVSEKIGGFGHGHVDNTSFILSAYGQRILVDSGGPYSYETGSELGLGTSFKAAYFRTAAAHNLLQMDGLDFDADTQVVKVIDAANHASVLATHAGYTNTDVSRQLVVLKDGVVISFDRADTQLTGTHTYALNWHFDPTATGLEAAAITDFAVGSAFVDAAFVAGSPATYEITAGRLGSDPQGWVATGLYAATPAPVMTVTQTANDAWFVSGFAVSDVEAPDLALSFHRDAGGYHGFVTHGTLGWIVEADDLGETAVETFTADAASVMRAGTDGSDRLNYATGNDLVIAKAGDDTISTRDGDDRILAGEGNDSVFAGNGNDYVSGGSGADMLRGGDGNDLLRGDVGDDKLIGDAGADTLLGGVGNDVLRGMDGNDILTGGDGIDRLIGGYGADLFVFDATAFSGRDIVSDFNVADGDRLQLDHLLFGYDPLSDQIEEFVRITQNTTHSYLSIDRDGAENGLSFIQIAALSYVHGLTDEAQLLSDGILLVDQMA